VDTSAIGTLLEQVGEVVIETGCDDSQLSHY
jgi:hypothetical protein